MNLLMGIRCNLVGGGSNYDLRTSERPFHDHSKVVQKRIKQASLHEIFEHETVKSFLHVLKQKKLEYEQVFMGRKFDPAPAVVSENSDLTSR